MNVLKIEFDFCASQLDSGTCRQEEKKRQITCFSWIALAYMKRKLV